MAIYKPNGFYPYMQEVDLENLEGNIFSCQVNTDGAMCAGGKIKIYSPDSDVVLYDNLYQFQEKDNYNNTIRTPIPNGGIANFKIEPYELNVNLTSDNFNDFKYNNSLILNTINFIYLNPQNTFEERKTYCPYNFFYILLNKNKYSIIMTIYKDGIPTIDICKVVNINDIQVNENNNYILSLNNIIDILPEEINSTNFNTYNIKFYITLKNDLSYLWEVELFEHYFGEQYDKSTFITDGYVTGSTKSVLWYNQHEQNNIVLHNDKNIKQDNYIQIEYTSENSNLFKEELSQGYTDKGILSFTNTDILKSIDTSNIETTDQYIKPYFLNNVVISGYKMNSASDSDYFYISPSTETFPSASMPSYYSGVIISYYGEYLSSPYSWYRVYNVTQENQNTLNFDHSYIGEECHRLCTYSNYEDQRRKDPTTESDFIHHPFCLGINRKYYDPDELIIVATPNTETTLGNSCTINGQGYKYIIISYINIVDYSECISCIQRDNHHVVTSGSIPLGKNAIACFYDGEFTLSKSLIYFAVHHNDLRNDYLSTQGFFMMESFFLDSHIYYFKNLLIYYDNILSDCIIKISNFQISYLNNSGKITIQIFIMEKDFSKKQIVKQSLINTYAGIKVIDDVKINTYKYKEPIIGCELICFPSESYPKNPIISKFSFNIEESNLNDDILFKITDNSVKILKNNYYLSLVSYDLSEDSTIPIYIKDSVTNISYNIKDILKNYLIKQSINTNIQLMDGYSSDIIKKFLTASTFYSDKQCEHAYSYNDLNIYYQIKYIQRKEISWINKQLGRNYNYNKIELKEPFDFNLNNGEGIYLYSTDLNTTYNSFYTAKDLDINVDNIYVRFPGYVGKDAMENEINDNIPYYYTTDEDNGNKLTATIPVYNSSGKVISNDSRGIKGWFYSDVDAYTDKSGTNKITWGTDIAQNVDLYGKQVRANAFERQDSGDHDGSYCKLFKVTSYDVNTGEIVFAGGLERKILDTDKYEIWQGNVIEGSSNSYDITEIIKSYTRIYPPADEYDNNDNSIEGVPLIDAPIKISNSTSNKIFIQPNINFYNNEYNKAKMKFKDMNSIRDILYFYNIDNNMIFEDLSIDKLDDSQWIINLAESLPQECLPGDIYELYIDTVKSIPANYFYAKSTPQIDIKFADYQYVKDNLEDNYFRYQFENLKDNFTSIIEEIRDVDGVISGTVTTMDTYFMTNYKNCDTPIKRYRYKLYDSNMNLIKDTDYIYDNLLSFGVKGLLDKEYYFLDFECENQGGKIDNYKQMFYVDYTKHDIENLELDINNENKLNCVVIKFTKPSSEWDSKIVSLYKTQQGDSMRQWIADIKLQEDQSNYIIYDYNVSNNMEYEYVLITKEDISKDEKYDNFEYSITSKKHKVCYNDWSIVDIIKEEDGLYYTDNDVWHFKYNLESNDIAINNSITVYDNLSKYPQFGYGKKLYESSGLSCLLGDVGVYNVISYKLNNINNDIIQVTKQRDGYHESVDNKSNNITKYLKWKKFSNNDNLKLLKDIKGNKWIVRINEKPVAKNNDNSQEQMYTISFEWTEAMNSNNISIIGIPQEE